MGNICTYCSNLFKVADVTAHQEGRRSHKKVKHPAGQDRDVRLLPQQGLKQASDDRLNGKPEDRNCNGIQCKIMTCR